ncbi:MAG TPA: nucleotidyltransferase domain-containing protein [Syntrophomonadaceae bacterium]|nr:nucleotidyltransferase domain-containing protein [Syntrophomonadaceae bacterium]
MMYFGLSEERLQTIRTVLAKYPKVKKAVIFGSRARGDCKYNSDIDLALYVMDKETFPPSLYLDLDEAAGIYKTNIIDMSELDNESLRCQIEEQGQEIYSATEYANT